MTNLLLVVSVEGNSFLSAEPIKESLAIGQHDSYVGVVAQSKGESLKNKLFWRVTGQFAQKNEKIEKT